MLPNNQMTHATFTSTDSGFVSQGRASAGQSSAETIAAYVAATTMSAHGIASGTSSSASQMAPDIGLALQGGIGPSTFPGTAPTGTPSSTSAPSSASGTPANGPPESAALSLPFGGETDPTGLVVNSVSLLAALEMSHASVEATIAGVHLIGIGVRSGSAVAVVLGTGSVVVTGGMAAVLIVGAYGIATYGVGGLGQAFAPASPAAPGGGGW